jgi:chemotaxis protein histidine kinase CheA
LHFILQEKGAAAGEHIVRARGAWFGNRSISAEINLEPGNYEVLPKIVASKNEAAPDVFDVVTKLADVNPQKLRQIGMNYDTANARGVVELTEEEKKRKEQKKKEAYDKKKKEKEDAEEEKTEFEAWKKERREREAKKGTETVKDEKKDAPVQSEKPATTQTADQKKEDTSSDLVEGSPKTEAPSTEKKETTEAEVNEKEKDGTSVSENSIPDNTTQVGATASTALSGDPEGDVADATPTPAPLPIPAPVTSKTNPWNAVCVLGLRVYSQDPDVSIKLIKPADPEEAAVLDADGATAAGATM